MKRFWIGAAIAAGLAATTAPALARQIESGSSIEDFVAGPTRSMVRLSPSGTRLAMVVSSGEVSMLVVQDLDTGEYRAVMEARYNDSFGGTGFDWLMWKGDDHVLVAAHLLSVERRRNADDGRITSYRAGRMVAALNADGSGGVELRAQTSEVGSPGEVIDVLEASPHHILMTVEDWRGALNVVRVDIRTGEAQPVLSGDNRTLSYHTDNGGEVVARVRRVGVWGRRHVIESLDPATGAWSEVAEITPDDLRDRNDFQLMGAADAPGLLYVLVRPEAGAQPDTTAAHIYDMRARELGPVLWRHDAYDLDSILIDGAGAFLGGCYWADLLRCEFEDERLGAHMTGVSRFFEDDRNVVPVSRTRDATKWVLFVSGPDEPGTYYLYDTVTRSVDVIGSAYGRVAPEGLRRTRRFDYAARDGAALHGYLTVPASASGAPGPLVVMPHGGPESRDALAYDPWVQFLASRGYAVFQPNFRGSSGFGRAFVEAGYGQWGRRMQDDVTDGVFSLIEHNLADPSRICIVGASYGGYAALWGGAREPDLYRCVISIAGVADLRALMRRERRVEGSNSESYEYWRASIGDPGRDRARLEAVSPIRFVEDWRPPVLLIHGDEDDVVSYDQSRDMDRALRRAGKEVRFVTLEGEGHSGWREDDHALALREIEAFLSRHLPVDSGPLPDQP